VRGGSHRCPRLSPIQALEATQRAEIEDRRRRARTPTLPHYDATGRVTGVDRVMIKDPWRL